MRQGQRHLLGWSKSVFAIEDHAVTGVQQQHGRARAFILGLTDHQVLILQIDRSPQALTRYGSEQRRADVQIESVSEFILLGGLIGFDACRKVHCLVPAEAAPSERSEKTPEQAES